MGKEEILYLLNALGNEERKLMKTPWEVITCGISAMVAFVLMNRINDVALMYRPWDVWTASILCVVVLLFFWREILLKYAEHEEIAKRAGFMEMIASRCPQEALNQLLQELKQEKECACNEYVELTRRSVFEQVPLRPETQEAKKRALEAGVKLQEFEVLVRELSRRR